TSSNICSGVNSTRTCFLTSAMRVCGRPRRRTAKIRDSTASRPGTSRSKDRPRPMSIIDNRKAFHDYFIEEKYEAGLVLEGWEVRATRAGRANIKEAYVMLRGEERFILGMHITALQSASSHVKPDPVRTRKLLLHAAEISKLI